MEVAAVRPDDSLDTTHAATLAEEAAGVAARNLLGRTNQKIPVGPGGRG